MVNRHEYSDVNDASYVKKNRNIANTDITIQFNTDGVATSESSNRSLWPLQIMINNLPLMLKQKYLLLCGLWFGATKPQINLYLKFFVEEMRKLNENGILRIKDNINVKVHAIVCVCDSVARPTLQNITQFNGKFGCTFCLQKGTTINDNNSRTYPDMRIQPLRSLQQHLRDAEEAVRIKEAVNGVKGPSVLLLLPNFDLTQGCSPDYMHSVLLGVVRLFLEEWFDSSNHSEPWYLGGKLLKKFDDKLIGIRPPCEISRPPRSIIFRKKWKASELRSFLLYYSFHCVNDLLPKKYVKHWSAFICGIGIFLSPIISEEKWRVGTEALIYFVENIGKLYNNSFYKFNVHLMLHIPNWVHQFGALWSTSCFPFEHFNGVLNRLYVNGTGVAQQICKRYFRFKKLMQISDKLFSNEHDVHSLQSSSSLFFRLLNYNEENSSYADDDDNFSQFSSKPKNQNLDSQMKYKIKAALSSTFEIADTAVVFQFFRMNGMLIHSYEYCDLKKRNNSIVKLKDGSFVAVTRIFKVTLLTSTSSDDPEETDIDKMEQIVLEALPLRNAQTESQYRHFNKFIREVALTKVMNIQNQQQRIIILPEMIDKKCIYIVSVDDPEVCLAVPLMNHLENGW